MLYETLDIVSTPDFDWKDYSVELKHRPDYNQAKFGIVVRYNQRTKVAIISGLNR